MTKRLMDRHVKVLSTHEVRDLRRRVAPGGDLAGRSLLVLSKKFDVAPEEIKHALTGTGRYADYPKDGIVSIGKLTWGGSAGGNGSNGTAASAPRLTQEERAQQEYGRFRERAEQFGWGDDLMVVAGRTSDAAVQADQKAYEQYREQKVREGRYPRVLSREDAEWVLENGDNISVERLAMNKQTSRFQVLEVLNGVRAWHDLYQSFHARRKAARQAQIRSMVAAPAPVVAQVQEQRQEPAKPAFPDAAQPWKLPEPPPPTKFRAAFTEEEIALAEAVRRDFVTTMASVGTLAARYKLHVSRVKAMVYGSSRFEWAATLAGLHGRMPHLAAPPQQWPGGGIEVSKGTPVPPRPTPPLRVPAPTPQPEQEREEQPTPRPETPSSQMMLDPSALLYRMGKDALDALGPQAFGLQAVTVLPEGVRPLHEIVADIEAAQELERTAMQELAAYVRAVQS